MVKKLMKHELYALFRVLVFLAVAALVFAAIGRGLIAANLSGGGDTLPAITILIVTFDMFAIVTLVAAAWALGISRFYKTMFTGEGYMTFSIPATPMQIVTAKLLSSLIAMFFASVVSALSLTIFLVGWEGDIMGYVGEVFGEIFQIFREFAAAEPLVFVEGILLMILSIPCSLLVIYAIISVGQMFTSRRKFYTVLLFFGVYIGGSILNTLVLMPLVRVSTDVSMHLTMWIYILLVAGIDVGCWFLIRYILKNKVNLIA